MNAPSTKRKPAAQLLADILERPVGSIPADASIHNFPAWDSLVHVKLMLAIEEATGGPIDPARMTMLADLQSVDRYLVDMATQPS